MEGVVRVSSADTNDRRNRWETGNGGGGGGEQGKNEHVLGSWAPRTKTTENERIPLPLSLSRSLVGPCRRLVGQQLPFTSPPTPRWKSWTNREGAFPATNDPQLHPRSSLCNVFSSDFVRILLRKATFFPRFFFVHFDQPLYFNRSL